MSTSHLVIAFSKKNISKIKKLTSRDKSIKWLYLGEDFFKRCHIEKQLGNKFERIDIARIHNEVAKNIRHEYVGWIDKLNRMYGKDLSWWLGPVASRDNYYSNLFQYCCYLEILERLWINKTSIPELVIVESVSLSKAIKKWAFKKDIEVKTLYNYHKMYDFLESYTLSFLRWGKFVIATLLGCLAAFITRKIYKQNKFNFDPYVMVKTYIHNYSLSDEGTFKDRYFPYLHEFLHQNKTQVIICPIFSGFAYNFFSIYSRLRKSATQFIIHEDFLKLSDYLRAFLYPLLSLSLSKKIENVSFRSYDVAEIIKEDFRNKFVSYCMQSILIHRLVLRLANAGLSLQYVITWFENHAMDKGMVAGFRRAFPQTKVIGAQMFMHYPNRLNLFVSQSEIEAQMAPEILIETSPYQCNIAQSFSKSIPCIPAAALRYSHVYNEGAPCKKFQGQSIFVLLSIDLKEAVELLKILIEGVDQLKEDVKIFIKYHPDYSSSALLNFFGKDNWPDKFRIFDGNMQEALDQAALVISSSSTSIVEAAAKGIPVIFLGRQTVLNQNILSDLNMEIVTECFSSDDLVTAINKYLLATLDEINQYKEMGNRIRNLFFTPVNEETMQPFLLSNT